MHFNVVRLSRLCIYSNQVAGPGITIVNGPASSGRKHKNNGSGRCNVVSGNIAPHYRSLGNYRFNMRWGFVFVCEDTTIRGSDRLVMSSLRVEKLLVRFIPETGMLFCREPELLSCINVLNSLRLWPLPLTRCLSSLTTFSGQSCSVCPTCCNSHHHLPTFSTWIIRPPPPAAAAASSS